MKTSLGQSPVKRQYAAEGGGMAETVPRHIGRSQRPVQGRNFPHVQCGFTPREEGSLLPPVLTTSDTCHCRNTQSNGSVVPTKRWPCACRAVGGVRFGVFVRVCVCVCEITKLGGLSSAVEKGHSVKEPDTEKQFSTGRQRKGIYGRACTWDKE